MVLVVSVLSLRYMYHYFSFYLTFNLRQQKRSEFVDIIYPMHGMPMHCVCYTLKPKFACLFILNKEALVPRLLLTTPPITVSVYKYPHSTTQHLLSTPQLWSHFIVVTYMQTHSCTHSPVYGTKNSFCYTCGE